MAITNHFFSFFPQYHSDPINDLAWGDGFTDWDLIKAVPELQRPAFIPSRGYYDPSSPEYLSSLSSQLDALPLHNAGLMVYHYNFDGVSALSGFEKQLLAQSKNAPPFFLCWANETWSKRWIGKPGEVLIKQKHIVDVDLIQKHARYLTQFFEQPNYHHVRGRPLFIVYDTNASTSLPEALRVYREAFSELGHNPLIGTCIGYSLSTAQLHPYDFGCEFQPRFFFNSRNSSLLVKMASQIKTRFPKPFEWIGGQRDRLRKLEGTHIFKYIDYLNAIQSGTLENQLGSIVGSLPLMRSTFLTWDNLPRYGNRSTRVDHCGVSFESLASLSTLHSQDGLPILINSWNEWSEGAALEPGLLNHPLRDEFFRVLSNQSH